MLKTGLGLLVIGVVSLGLGLANGQNKCSYLEVAVRGFAPQRDRFCKPWLTLPAKLNQLRWCLCKKGYIRNSWDQCVEESQCGSCWYRRNMDFNQCSSACPLVCGKRVPTICTEQCVVGCACPPGFVLDPWRQKACVPASWCPPRCPRNSVFQICASTCSPTCRRPRPSGCEIRCHEGECVCLPGFYKTYRDGKEMCVRWNQCPSRAE